MKKPILGAALIMACAPAAYAQNDSNSPLISDVTICRDIADDSDRLACYDRAVGRLAEAEEAQDIVVMSREEVREARRASFGCQRGDFPELVDADGDGERRELATTITGVRNVIGGFYILTLAEGGVWETREASRRLSPDDGDEIIIRPAALGSFMARIGGQRPVRVRRFC